MRKKPTCNDCGKRSRCVQLCSPMNELVRKVEHHFRGEEILVDPGAIEPIFQNHGLGLLPDFIVNDVRPWEVRRIPGLTEKQLRVMTLSLAHRKTSVEIARKLGINQSTVGSHLQAARRKARRWLETYLRNQKHYGKKYQTLFGNKAG